MSSDTRTNRKADPARSRRLNRRRLLTFAGSAMLSSSVRASGQASAQGADRASGRAPRQASGRAPGQADASAASDSLDPPDPSSRHTPEQAREIVSVSHGNLLRVKELVAGRPALARAAWDWGFGDWETALGAASHVGNKEIASVLLAAGAHPTIFSAAMLGQLETVKAFIGASPGIQRTRGPHGISLLAHARAGGNAEVVRFLEQLGDADPRYPSEPFSAGDPEALAGVYVVQSSVVQSPRRSGSMGGGTAASRHLVVKLARGSIAVSVDGDAERLLYHHGARTFNPAGSEAVRIAFEPESGAVRSLTITDGPLFARAIKA